MATQKSLVKQAEQTCLNTAKDLQGLLTIIDALAHAGSKMFNHQSKSLDDFSEGIQLIRSAIYEKYAHSIINCFMFTGVGGKQAIDYAAEQFKERFGTDRYVIMNLLNEHGTVPSKWDADMEEEFQKEAKKLIKINEKGE